MQELGASQEVIEAAMRHTKAAEDFELFEDNVLSVTVFQKMATQWRFIPGTDKPMPLGLDYAALPFVMGTCGVKAAARMAVFEDLQILEQETLAIIAERAK